MNRNSVLICAIILSGHIQYLLTRTGKYREIDAEHVGSVSSVPLLFKLSKTHALNLRGLDHCGIVHRREVKWHNGSGQKLT